MHTISLALNVAIALALVGGFFALRGKLLSSGQLIAQIDRFIAWVPSHGAQLRRYFAAAQAVTGAFLLVFGYAIGRDHLHLIRVGHRTEGIIVRFVLERVHTASGTGSLLSMSLPIVKFQAGGKPFQFKDWMEQRVNYKELRVTVLYDPANPSTAMIYRPVYDWIPWAPTMGVGAFLLLASVSSWLRSRSANPWPSPGTLRTTLRYKWTSDGLKKDDGPDPGR